MFRSKYSLLLFILLNFVFSSKAQFKIDSLIRVLKVAKDDAGKAAVLYQLAWEMDPINRDSAIILAKKYLELAERKDLSWYKARGNGYLQYAYQMKGEPAQAHLYADKEIVEWKRLINSSDTTLAKTARKELPVALVSKAEIFSGQNKFTEALSLTKEGLKLVMENQNKKSIIHCYSRLRDIYLAMGDYPGSLDCGFKALSFADQLDSANLYQSIGTAYLDMSNGRQAIIYHKKALSLFQKYDSNFDVALALLYLGNDHSSLSEYEKSKPYYEAAYKLAKEMNEMPLVAALTSNMGSVHKHLKNYDTALHYFFTGLDLMKSEKDFNARKNTAITYGNIGEAYLELKDYKKSESFLKAAMTLSDSLAFGIEIRETHKRLSRLYEATGKHNLALEYLKKSIRINDSLFSKENADKIAQLERRQEAEKKELEMKAEQEKQAAILIEEKKRQLIIIAFISLVLIIVFVFSILLYRRFKASEEQKKIIEEKNKEITDSIRYAKRIQSALLPTKKYLERVLK